MITAAALVPHPPLLLRELGGAEDPVAELRAAVLDAVRDVLSGAEKVIVIGPAGDAVSWDPTAGIDVRGFGTTGGRLPHPGLPLSLGVGDRLLHDAGWTGPVDARSVAWDASGRDVEAAAEALTGEPLPTAALLLGDGSARRSEKAPGYLDERAFPFDDALAKALTDGDATALAELDAGVADELMVGGATFRLLGALALRRGTVHRAALTHRSDPFGVTYLVATWHFSR